MKELTGRTVLVTGSSRGIGAACARAAAAAGATVVVHGRAPSDPLRAIAAELGCTAIHADGTDPAAVRAALAATAEDGLHIDVLVNAIGATGPRTGLATTDQDWIEAYRVNLLAPLHFVQCLAPAMKAAGYGRIVNITSMRGLPALASEQVMAYSAAKAALTQLTTALARSLAPQVAVNAVAPGFVLTDLAAGWSDQVRRQADESLLGRPAVPAEIADAVIFLAGGRAPFVTGQTLVVDGGYGIAGK